MKCPSCGQEAAGKFCSNCGAALAGASCPSCSAPLSAGARFCHVCGTALGAPRRPAAHGAGMAGGQAALVPWIVTGIAVAVLVVVLVARFGGAGAPAPAQASAAGAPGAGQNGMVATTDISQMSPQEQADRLFDRVMTAHEAGDSQQVAFFGPMALQATAMLGPLNDDEHFHVGLLNAALGNYAATTAEADTIAKSDPRHLFVPLLRWEVASHDKDSAAMRRAYRQFLDNYDKEMASGRPEYAMHKTRLEAFHDEARGAVGKTGG
jgi:Double zinc ribbon